MSGVDEEPHPARPPATKMVGARLVGHRIAADDERRREIERARANGLTTELRDGRIFTVLHLPPHGPQA